MYIFRPIRFTHLEHIVQAIKIGKPNAVELEIPTYLENQNTRVPGRLNDTKKYRFDCVRPTSAGSEVL